LLHQPLLLLTHLLQWLLQPLPHLLLQALQLALWTLLKALLMLLKVQLMLLKVLPLLLATLPRKLLTLSRSNSCALLKKPPSGGFFSSVCVYLSRLKRNPIKAILSICDRNVNGEIER
jgi:hypothetical protein